MQPSVVEQYWKYAKQCPCLNETLCVTEAAITVIGEEPPAPLEYKRRHHSETLFLKKELVRADQGSSRRLFHSS